MHSKNTELIILVYLLATFCIPSSLGIYKNTINSTKSLSTAVWDVDITPDNNSSLRVIPDSTNATYTLEVSNDSEVDVEYKIIISNLPNGVQVKLDDEQNFRNPTNNVITIDNAGTIAYGGQPVIHTLTFRATTAATIVNNQTVNINVEFKQTT